MVSLGQKIKIAKNMRKGLYNYIIVVLSTKRMEKAALYSRNERILKIGKNGHQAKVIAFAKWSVCVKKSNC